MVTASIRQAPSRADRVAPDEELVEEPFRRLIADRKLLAHRYDGFWTAMDTFKDKQHLDDLHASGSPPWEVRRLPEMALAGA